MSSLHVLLLDLLRMAETPLYSACGWLGSQLGRQVSMSEFIELIRDLLDKELVRLWSVDPESGQTKELHDIPADLAERYAALGHSDQRYDPLGLSLTAGLKAHADPEPDWEVTIDFERGTFDLSATPSAVGEALRQLDRDFPDLDIVPVTTTHEGRGTRIVGRVVAHEEPIRRANTPSG